MDILDVLRSLWDVLWLNGSHDKKCTVGCSPEKSLYRLDSSDGVDIAEVVGTHDVCR